MTSINHIQLRLQNRNAVKLLCRSFSYKVVQVLLKSVVKMGSEADDVPVEELKKLEVAEDDEVTPGYTAPAKVDLKTIQSLDADDESLRKYKADLLKDSESKSYSVLFV